MYSVYINNYHACILIFICFFKTAFIVPHLDIFAFVLEVDPGVGVAPDQEREEEGAHAGRHQHQHQAQQALVARRDQRAVVQPNTKDGMYMY